MRLIDLPWPPSVNHYWRRNGGRYFISPEGQRYRAEVMLACGESSPLTGRIAVGVALYPPDKRRRDVDNCAKSLLDSLQKAGVYEDDCQVDVLALRRMEVEPGGRCVVCVCPVSEWDANVLLPNHRRKASR